jgi:acetyl-CoA carboxylase beta subunit
MLCKASPIGPRISALIEDARVNLAPTILSAREGGVRVQTH